MVSAGIEIVREAPPACEVPKVTVIIATYNWSEVLPFSIGSVQRQTRTDWELLVIGDGCTDNSAEVVGALAGDDRRIRWINLPENTGHQTGPNNEGLRQARGDFIAYLGHDDLWLPHHLESLLTPLENGESPADVTYGLVGVIPPGGGEPTCIPENGVVSATWRWHPPTGLAHRRQLAVDAGGWRTRLEVSVAPETELVARLVSMGARVVFVPRLVAVKFPASWRKDSYRLRRSDEQAAWSKRIACEDDFEQRELVALATRRMPPISRQVRWSLRQRAKRIAFGTMRGRAPWPWERWFVRRSLRLQREFRGLDPVSGSGTPVSSPDGP